MRIAICKAYGQDFYSDAPADLKEGETVFVQYAKNKKTAAEVVAIGEYEDGDKVLKMLLKGKPKKQILGKIEMFGGAK